jgi:phosphohistidine phosphatase
MRAVIGSHATLVKARRGAHVMKTLYVLRHGQAAPEGAADSDHERELTPRGRAEVLEAAQCLRDGGKPPTLILASSATRARQTAQQCADTLPGPPSLTLLEGLYLAEPPSYLAALAARAKGHAGVLVVGHNPGLEALIYVLTDRSEHLATASLVEIALPIAGWTALSDEDLGLGRVVRVFRA